MSFSLLLISLRVWKVQKLLIRQRHKKAKWWCCWGNSVLPLVTEICNPIGGAAFLSSKKKYNASVLLPIQWELNQTAEVQSCQHNTFSHFSNSSCGTKEFLLLQSHKVFSMTPGNWGIQVLRSLTFASLDEGNAVCPFYEKFTLYCQAEKSAKYLKHTSEFATLTVQKLPHLVCQYVGWLMCDLMQWVWCPNEEGDSRAAFKDSTRNKLNTTTSLLFQTFKIYVHTLCNLWTKITFWNEAFKTD